MPSLTLYMTMKRADPTECPECHFDSLEQMTFIWLKITGVGETMRTFCPRCTDSQREDW